MPRLAHLGCNEDQLHGGPNSGSSAFRCWAREDEPCPSAPSGSAEEREFGTMNGGWGSVWEDMHGKAVVVWCG